MYYHPNEEEGNLPFVQIMKWISAISALFALVLLVDYIIPHSCSNETVIDKEFRKESTRFGSTSYDLKIVTTNFEFKVKPDLFAVIEPKSEIELCHTPLLKRVKKVSGTIIKENIPFEYQTTAPIYRGYASFPISLLITSLMCLFFKRDDTVAYGFGFFTVVLLITMLSIL
jgi:hypothetical protein